MSFSYWNDKLFLETAAKSIRSSRKTNEVHEMMEITGRPAFIDEAKVRGKYEILTKRMIEQGSTITTMESCTAGQVASLITDTEGSSAVLKGALVTYSNEAKILQGVPEKIIETYGVYSAETAAAMAVACRNTYRADFGVGVTGSFGNADPNNPDSVPGEVFFAIALGEETQCFHCRIPVQPSRLCYKLYMADVIVDVLLQQKERKLRLPAKP